MSKGRSGQMPGVGGARAHLSRKQLRGGRGGHGQPHGAGRTDPQQQKRELLRKLQESREKGTESQGGTSDRTPQADR